VSKYLVRVPNSHPAVVNGLLLQDCLSDFQANNHLSLYIPLSLTHAQVTFTKN